MSEAEPLFGEPAFIDSNVPMYVAGRDHPYRAPCLAILTRAATGELEAVTSVEVHQEILHRFLALHLAPQAQQVSADFHRAVPAVFPVAVDDMVLARELLAAYPTLPARDLIHVAVMLNHGIRVIVSADRHFDSVAQITRLDPMNLASG